jgi:hypothetical protein
VNRIVELLTMDLRHLIADLGRDGGLISPSIYDTAQVVRLTPPAEGVWPALNWLIDQQQADGGWGDPVVPRARDVPTLAAVLALSVHQQRRAVRESLQAGVAFLRRQAAYWSGPLPEDIPIGIELLLPALLDEAARQGIALPTRPYAELIALGARRRALIARLQPGAGSTAVHSWEVWGVEPTPDLLDSAVSIGHSPAATAAWAVAAAAAHPDEAIAARRYLERAAAATATGIPGVVPTVFPIARFENLFGLYALMMTDLLAADAFADEVGNQISNMRAALRPNGYSFSDHFDPDGDDTAAALTLLFHRKQPVDLDILRWYAKDGHFCTWQHELQSSLSATARAAHTLVVAGAPVEQHLEYLAQWQTLDGRWTGDKWNSSWLYTTSHVVQSLAPLAQYAERLDLAFDTLLAYQKADGGWGTNGRSTPIETAYGVMTLRTLRHHAAFHERVTASLDRAHRYLERHYRPCIDDQTMCWIGKEMYRPYRVDRAFELSALLALELDHVARH